MFLTQMKMSQCLSYKFENVTNVSPENENVTVFSPTNEKCHKCFPSKCKCHKCFSYQNENVTNFSPIKWNVINVNGYSSMIKILWTTFKTSVKQLWVHKNIQRSKK